MSSTSWAVTSPAPSSGDRKQGLFEFGSNLQVSVTFREGALVSTFHISPGQFLEVHRMLVSNHVVVYWYGHLSDSKTVSFFSFEPTSTTFEIDWSAWSASRQSFLKAWS